jgi:putative transposase
VTMTELCLRFGVSRQAGYGLILRQASEGLGCVLPRSRAPHRQGQAMAPDLKARILALRRARPTWGPRKLKAYLERIEPRRCWPAASTMGDLIKREGLVRPRRRRGQAMAQARPFGQVRGANDLWCADFKGWFRTGDGARCDTLTVTDAYSRYLLDCRIVPPTHAGVEPVVERLMREHGLPRAIRSDNGPPFASTGAGGLTRLAVRWLKLGIALERIEPGRPNQNGRHERMHATLKAETLKPPAANPAAQQACFDAFREDFNRVRPHEALGQTPPASQWTASPRPWPGHLLEPHYPDTCKVRRVRSNGCIKWRGQAVFINQALAGEPVGLTETDTGEAVVSYFDIRLGLIDRAASRMRRFASPRPGRGEAKPEQTINTVNHVSGL